MEVSGNLSGSSLVPLMNRSHCSLGILSWSMAELLHSSSSLQCTVLLFTFGEALTQILALVVMIAFLEYNLGRVEVKGRGKTRTFAFENPFVCICQ